MKRIENGNVEYFLLRMLNNYVDLMRSVRILEHSTDVSTSKRLEKIIEDNREMMANMYQNLYTYVIFELIIATNDSDYIKSIIDSKENRKKFELNNEYIVDLIKVTNDPKYIKSIIESEEKRNELKLNDVYYIVDLIKSTNDIEYIKSIMKSEEKRKKLKFNADQIFDLIKATNDSYYIKSIVDSKAKREELGLNDVGYIFDLIKATNDPAYIKSKVDSEIDGEGFGFSIMQILELIVGTEDSEYIKSIVDTKEKSKKLKLDNNKYYYVLIKVTNDPAYIKGKVDSEIKGEGFGFTPRQIFDLIKATNDSKYIESIIDSKEIREGLELTKFNIFELILRTNDSGYMKSIVDSKEKRKELNLNDEDIVHLIVATDDPDYMKKYLDEIGNEDIKIEYNGEVVLPEDMTIGIEIESEGKNSVILRYLSGTIEKRWEHKNDGSLSNGIEIVSPILTGDNEMTSNSIKKVCTYLNKLRTDCIRKMWGTYSYRSRLFNYTKELDEFNRNMGKYRKNIIYNKQ